MHERILCSRVVTFLGEANSKAPPRAATSTLVNEAYHTQSQRRCSHLNLSEDTLRPRGPRAPWPIKTARVFRHQRSGHRGRANWNLNLWSSKSYTSYYVGRTLLCLLYLLY